MPIDLSPAGLPSAYPVHAPRLLPWLFGWVLCCGVGAAIVLLLWPASTPASGAWFWLCLFGIPNAVFFITLAIARTVYEADYLYARLRNQHRAAWLGTRIHAAQQPLQVLGVGYYLPLDGQSIGEVLAGTTSLLEARVPRNGSRRIVHTRFADDDAVFDQNAGESVEQDDTALEITDTEHDAAQTPDDEPVTVQPVVRVIELALAPLVERAQTLSQCGPKCVPAVRVMSDAEMADARVAQAKQALQRVGLGDLECRPVSATDGLMLADAWLDAAEQRPLLVIAAEWQDAPPLPGSTEGAVTVLLGPETLQLPETTKALGRLHRPVADALEDLDAVLTNSVLWGNADTAAVATAWISGLDSSHDTKLLAALRSANLAGLAQQETQRQPDRMVGRIGAAGGWLSIAAAIEAGSGTQLILHVPVSTSIAQAAILHVSEETSDEEPDDECTE